MKTLYLTVFSILFSVIVAIIVFHDAHAQVGMIGEAGYTPEWFLKYQKDSNSLSVIRGETNGGSFPNGTGYIDVVFHGYIGTEDATHPVTIKTLYKNVLLRTYSIPTSTLDINNGTFIFRPHLILHHQNDTYVFQFSYGNQTVKKQYPYVFGTTGHFIFSSNYIAPLRQIVLGVPPNDVSCDVGLKLVIKSEDGSPACVTLGTAMTLLKRGWAMDETAHPEGSSHYVTSTNSTIIPGHMHRGSCGVMASYYYSSSIVNYTGFADVNPSPFMYWGKQDDFVLAPGSTGTITYEINASLSHGTPVITPFVVPKFLEMTNYAIFYHEITSLATLAKYPGVTINDHYDFKACLVRPTGEGLCIGGDQNGNDTIEAYVADHPGVHALFEPPSEAFQPDAMQTQSYKQVTMVITADKDAARGTYFVVISPECGGVSFLLTVGEKPYQE